MPSGKYHEYVQMVERGEDVVVLKKERLDGRRGLYTWEAGRVGMSRYVGLRHCLAGEQGLVHIRVTGRPLAASD